MEVPSVDKVERNLLALYKKLVGPGVWPRTHVIEWDAFLLIIKTCVFEFWYPTAEGDWATRWDWKKKTWVDDEETGFFLREMREEDEEALIRGKVREQLEKAAQMTALKAKYSPEAQRKFNETLRYVKSFCTSGISVQNYYLLDRYVIDHTDDGEPFWQEIRYYPHEEVKFKRWFEAKYEKPQLQDLTDDRLYAKYRLKIERENRRLDALRGIVKQADANSIGRGLDQLRLLSLE